MTARRQTARRARLFATSLGASAASAVIAILPAGWPALAQTQSDAQAAAQAPRIEVLSSRPELVTGGDALVRIFGSLEAPTVMVGARDVTEVFRPYQRGGWIGLVRQLADGNNQLMAKTDEAETAVTLVNHPINGTLFAGPQQQPFVCENEVFGLAAAHDASCAAPSIVAYFYRNRAGAWRPFALEGPRPADLAVTTTTEGRQVPLIVRQERGVINRSAYLINILHDPAAGALPAPGEPSSASGWNGKLVYSFGGGVQANYHMGRGLGGMTGTDGKNFMEDLGAGFLDEFIAGGYAVAAGSLNVMGTNNDDVKSAETVAKIKEHFIKEFGPPLFTIGHGASGGSMQQHLIANNYPGLLDGIMPARSYPDAMSFLQPIYDCELLERAFDGAKGKWTDEQKGAVAGKFWGYCVSNGTRYPNQRADNCDITVRNLLATDPRLKARVRCTYQDNLVSTFGNDPETGYARSPFDNVGVQYGLRALNDGKISFDQFAEVNSRIGGFGINGKVVPGRMVGDELALHRAYASGRVNDAGGGLASIPIVDIRSYVDGAPPAPFDAMKDVDVHDGYHSGVMRARLIKANGNAGNQVMITVASVGRVAADTRTEGSPLTQASALALLELDRWLTNIANDRSALPPARKVAANRPADFVDACYPTVAGAQLKVEKVTDMERCKTIFRFSGDARLVAGAPATDDVFKCALKPIDAADYKPGLTPEQLTRLKQIFPDGVCDYTKPGVGQGPLAGTWMTFAGNGEATALEPRR